MTRDPRAPAGSDDPNLPIPRDGDLSRRASHEQPFERRGLTAGYRSADDFDFSTPEGEAAIRAANAIVLEVTRPLARRVALYERTLGLAVIPILVRRAIIDRWRLRRGRKL